MLFRSVSQSRYPTEKTYPLPLNLKTLQNETDIIEIIQTANYFTACPENPEIPQINNAPQLKSKIPQIKKHLQEQQPEDQPEKEEQNPRQGEKPDASQNPGQAKQTPEQKSKEEARRMLETAIES